MILMRFLQILGVFIILSSSALAQDVKRPQPEISTGYGDVVTARGQDFMIVTANAHATRAGYGILQKGGSAVDAAIAAQLVLGLVEPQSSGLGGGAFVLYYDGLTKELTSYDGRETAPNLAGPFLFQKNGEAMVFFDAVVGGRSVGVPGVPALLKEMHEIHGTLTWMELFDDAIGLAEEGFEVSPRLAKMVGETQDRLSKHPETAAYFLPQGKPVQTGAILKNPAYADTLKDYRFYGPSRFYRGRFTAEIVAAVQNFEANPGLLSPYDFEAYKVKERDPVCGPYRSYIVCSMGQPSSGGLTLLQILGMLDYFDLSGLGPDHPESWHLIAQASALAFADRNLYMADPDFVNTPGLMLIDPDYVGKRAVLIDPEMALEEISPGRPMSWEGPLYESVPDTAQPGTSHISVVDKDGNIVSMTSSIEGAFGSHVMVGGYLLNNQLTDFAFTPFDDQRKLVANMVEGGKRPRSSMSPTIVFDAAGTPVLVVGSAGGSRIIGYVLEKIIATLDWDMPLEEAMAMKHTLARGPVVETEDPALEPGLKALENQVEVKALTSGLTAIQIQNSTLMGAADPRREGTALGQ